MNRIFTFLVPALIVVALFSVQTVVAQQKPFFSVYALGNFSFASINNGQTIQSVPVSGASGYQYLTLSADLDRKIIGRPAFSIGGNVSFPLNPLFSISVGQELEWARFGLEENVRINKVESGIIDGIFEPLPGFPDANGDVFERDPAAYSLWYLKVPVSINYKLNSRVQASIGLFVSCLLESTITTQEVQYSNFFGGIIEGEVIDPIIGAPMGYEFASPEVVDFKENSGTGLTKWGGGIFVEGSYLFLPKFSLKFRYSRNLQNTFDDPEITYQNLIGSPQQVMEEKKSRLNQLSLGMVYHF
ncbi:outer membrane beta-barrel protein [Xanthovirga aplysinae]|uniref:outer membrane beta-barrel protein n=1 Tax=Xanthovirga aplysinae TaxID=2529853 RepID=UPI0012BBB02A|nr:outer membrane beta-barrel protein [Xanthovirga aplysinae]MTI30083.1 hypothetical protein [Xanthovirga aplysinae]